MPLQAFLPALSKVATADGYKENGPEVVHSQPTFTPAVGQALGVERIMDCLAPFLNDQWRLIVDPGDSLFASIELPAQSLTLASAYLCHDGVRGTCSIGRRAC
ncbi:hypothetical protein [Polynucleobacter necessarius]|uniref:hypothetical protein n=1 Tax=Polynucleobacter necessarius TaxID=576610 RepID=UPI0013B05A91|nr:hypothetical protein [Polynucleobacter necessarius]